MDRNSQEGNLGELLDNALEGYSNVEPREGLEGRILANLATVHPEERTWLRWWPAIGLAAAAAIALAVFLTMPRVAKPTQIAVKPSSGSPYVHAADAVETSMAIEQPAKAVKHGPHIHGGRKVQEIQAPQLAAVKQPVFPAPSPLTDQERLLFNYMRKTDRAEIAANAKPDVLPVMLQPNNEQLINQVSPGQRNTDTNTNTR